MITFEELIPFTKANRERFEAMTDAIDLIERESIVGDIVECGVWRGGTIILARKLAPRRMCWLYDTFEGMTEPGPQDMRNNGYPAMQTYKSKLNNGRRWAACSLAEVREHLATMDVLDETHLRFVVGDVAQTLLDPCNLPDRIALLHLDTDWHASTKIELEVLYPRMSIGGILIVDDYGHWLGARAAVDQYFADQNVELHKIDYTAVMARRQATTEQLHDPRASRGR